MMIISSSYLLFIGTNCCRSKNRSNSHFIRAQSFAFTRLSIHLPFACMIIYREERKIRGKECLEREPFIRRDAR